MSGPRVIVIGGGASGVILAAHLLRAEDSRVQVTIVEQRPSIGRGIAYGTDERDHILNTRAGSMSAYPEDTEHFWRWLLASGAADDLRCSDPFCFVARQHFGAYLADLVKPRLSGSGDGRLTTVTGECVGVRETSGGIVADLSDGTSHIGHAAVLATGHTVPAFGPGSPYLGAFENVSPSGIGPDDSVLILGTGLSMADAVIQLANEGHHGPVVALSRCGQLPRVHRRNAPLRIDAADVPFGTEVSYLLAWFRRTAEWATERGGDWRDVVDGIRPHTARLWASLPPDAKLRFLRHARPWWEVHRHRLPPESEQRIRAALSTGHLRLVAGQFLGLDTSANGTEARFRRRGGAAVETLAVARVIDCTGILRDPESVRSGLVPRLIAAGTARPDPLHIGIEVDERCAVVDRAGDASQRLFAVGPVTRARFWEVTAVPDIRLQAAELAGRIRTLLQPTRRNGAPLGRAAS